MRNGLSPLFLNAILQVFSNSYNTDVLHATSIEQYCLLVYKFVVMGLEFFILPLMLFIENHKSLKFNSYHDQFFLPLIIKSRGLSAGVLLFLSKTCLVCS